MNGPRTDGGFLPRQTGLSDVSLWRACREHRWLGLLIASLLLLHGTLAVQTARYCSVTHDEYWHIPVGLLHWRSGRFDWENLNPPLIRMLAAAPLTVTARPGAISEPTDQIWSYGDDLVRANRDRYRTLLILARLPIVLLSVLTAWLLGCWATGMFGIRSGVLAVLLWSASPTVLANASLATTDLGAAFFFVLTGWSSWRFAGRPDWKRAGLLGVCLGLAQLAKYTSVLLWPLSLAWCLLLLPPARPRRGPGSGSSADAHRSTDTAGNTDTAGSGDSAGCADNSRGAGAGDGTAGAFDADPDRNADTVWNSRQAARRQGAMLIRWGVAAAVSVAVLNIGYLFQGTGTSLAGYSFSSRAMTGIQSAAGFLGDLPLPVPSDWLQGIDHQRRMMESQHPVYLNGQWSLNGFRSYYLHVLWYKIPHVIQLLCLAALFRLWQQRSDRHLLRVSCALLLPMGVLLLLASGSSMQLGIRYVLPALPFLFLFVTPLAAALPRRRRMLWTVANAMTVVALLAGLRHHPHYLAWFNELAGGPASGWHLLSDSNIDWGQDLYALREWVEQNEIDDLHLAWFGTQSPADAGLDFLEVPSPVRNGSFPEPGCYAVSVCLLQGRPTPIRTPDGAQRVADFDEFGWLRFFEPAVRVGWSVHVYRLTEADLRRLRAALQQIRQQR